MSLDFMKPDIWDGLVIGVVFIGLALAILRVMNDYRLYQHKQRRIDMVEAQPPHDNDTE